MGPYGIRYLGEQLTDLVSSQVKELKVSNYGNINLKKHQSFYLIVDFTTYGCLPLSQKIVTLNKEALLNLHMNRDKAEVFNDNLRRLKS